MVLPRLTYPRDGGTVGTSEEIVAAVAVVSDALDTAQADIDADALDLEQRFEALEAKFNKLLFWVAAAGVALPSDLEADMEA